jgi:hypothetical protein
MQTGQSVLALAIASFISTLVVAAAVIIQYLGGGS